MPTARQPGESIEIATVPNLRDLGGWSTPDGRVRSGVIFRSAEFADLAGDDAAAFAALDIRSVYDMRTADERAANPNRLPAGVEYVVVDILKDATGASPAQILQLLSDPAAAAATLGDGKAVAIFEHAYRQLVSIPSALTGYARFFTDIAQPRHRPAVFHCTTGKDRTGWGAASLLLLLGVSEDDVMKDYLLTNDQLLPALQPMVDRFVSIGGDADVLAPVIGVREEYLRAAIDEMTTRYTTIERYFSDGLGLDDATIAALRSSFVAPGS